MRFNVCFVFHLKVKSKSPSSSSRTTTTTKTTRVRQKKVFSLPGQRCDPPEEVWLWSLHFLLLFWIMSFVLKASFILMFTSLFFWQREPLRIFYESLSKQIPTSEMAEFWWAFPHQLLDHKWFLKKMLQPLPLWFPDWEWDLGLVLVLIVVHCCIAYSVSLGFPCSVLGIKRGSVFNFCYHCAL